ncbi:MAG: hypothetical protein RIM23_25395 [Coleofasciculus sp. G3-WIS-01]|uniref:hypothetical protein n=1 Tax=Coleofasciculus sp. G3-WIS-01 TaxID=3069528 RepID=UPI0032FCA4E8
MARLYFVTGSQAPKIFSLVFACVHYNTTTPGQNIQQCPEVSNFLVTVTSPVPVSPFPVPVSLFPVPVSLFPVPLTNDK